MSSHDLEQARRIYDALETAIASQNPAVKEALKELLLITALSEKNKKVSPVNHLSDKVDRLEYEMQHIHREMTRLREELNYKTSKRAREEMERGWVSGGTSYGAHY